MALALTIPVIEGFTDDLLTPPEIPPPDTKIIVEQLINSAEIIPLNYHIGEDGIYSDAEADSFCIPRNESIVAVRAMLNELRSRKFRKAGLNALKALEIENMVSADPTARECLSAIRLWRSMRVSIRRSERRQIREARAVYRDPRGSWWLIPKRIIVGLDHRLFYFRSSWLDESESMAQR